MKILIDGYTYKSSPRCYYSSKNNGQNVETELHCSEEELIRIKTLFENLIIFKFGDMDAIIEQYSFTWISEYVAELKISIKGVAKND
jgi:hypothetical protein